jgi:tetratricopeptide (TPR) repeat protein
MERANELIEKGEAELKKGMYESASILLGQAIEVMDELDGNEDLDRQMAKVLRMKSFSDSRKGDYIVAVKCATRALDKSKSIKDLEGEADALRRLGYVHWMKADYQMSMEFYHNALDKAESCGASLLGGCIKLELGNLFGSMNENQKSVRAYLDSIDILTKEKDLNELARAYNNLGSRYLNMERYEDAISALKKSMDVAKEAGDMSIHAWAAFNVAECFIKMGRPEESFGFLEPILPVLEKSEDRVGITITHLNYALAYSALKQWDKAEDSFKKGLAVVRGLEMPSLEGEVLEEMGKMYLAKGDNRSAKENLGSALKIYTEADLKTEAERTKAILDQM